MRDASRSKLLSATLRLLAHKGYEAMTMQEVVASAGTSIGNAYFYFQNKEGLVTAAVEMAVDDVLAESEAIAMQLPAGPHRLATLLACNARALEDRRDRGPTGGLGTLLVATDHRLATIRMVEDKAIATLVRHLAGCFPDRAEAELPVIAAAIFGFNRSVVLRRLRGQLDMDLESAIAFTISWSLRALGVREAEIQRIVGEVASSASSESSESSASSESSESRAR